jgi:uncharacterized integral membrane protein
METTKAQQRIIANVQRAYRWRIVNAWVLGTASVTFCVFAILMVVLLVLHLHAHEVSLSSLFVVLWESQHPTHVQVLTVFTSGMLIVLFMMVALQCATATVVVLLRAREQNLLLQLWKEDAGENRRLGGEPELGNSVEE